MPWTRFQDLVETQTLYFASASKFEDKKEGHHTTLDDKERDRCLRRLGFGDKELGMAAEANAVVATHNQSATVINCWTLELADNSRMWREYGRSDEAVMIESTVGRLRYCLGQAFLIVQVSYLDFDRASIPWGHSLLPFLYKRAAEYDWEKEVRVIGEMDRGALVGTPRRVPVKLGDILTRVVVSPTATHRFAEKVESLARTEIPSVRVESKIG
jgi:hypothetical protein